MSVVGYYHRTPRLLGVCLVLRHDFASRWAWWCFEYFVPNEAFVHFAIFPVWRKR